jgi:uncharacterized protein (TIGR00730 family)
VPPFARVGSLHAMKRVCIFCGSSPGTDPSFAQAARDLATGLASSGLEIVYGGAKCGLMGIVADAALKAGGRVIGVLPRALQEKELAHPNLTALHLVTSMHERKALMADLSDAFVALPGGFGTLDEFCEILTWAQLGIHAKPCGLLNVNHFFDGFLSQVQTAIAGGLTRPEHAKLIRVAATAEAMLSRLQEPIEAVLPKWMESTAR